MYTHFMCEYIWSSYPLFLYRLQNIDEKLSTLVQMFWLGASLLESDYEYEFLLAVNLLKQVITTVIYMYICIYMCR